MVIPAAGVGKRMRERMPKQYLPLHGRPVIQHTLDCFLHHPDISGLVVAISAEDEYWQDISIECDKPVYTVSGGTERCHSVRNALEFLSDKADSDDWVLVHDAARPCLRKEDIDKLIDTVSNESTGGLLAIPVRDTMKRADAAGRSLETVERAQLWHAQTPQMFHLDALLSALNVAIERGNLVTDEAAAIEQTGALPLLVEGHADNIKITHPEDLQLAAFFLEFQHGLPFEDDLSVDEIDGLSADEG